MENNTSERLDKDAVYPVCDTFYSIPMPDKKNVRAKWTGEKRRPRKDEWYLSGSIINAYQAPNDLTHEYHIAKLVKVITRTVTDVIGDYKPPQQRK